MIFKQPKRKATATDLQDLQRKLASFEDDILPHLPEKDLILARAKARQLKKKRLLMGVSAGMGLLLSIYIYNPVYQQLNVQTAKAQQKSICLSDGSCLDLNSASEIQVSQRLRSREVTLIRGEVRFHVAHHHNALFKHFERPFMVRAGQLEILDIGTIFNVLKHNQSDATVAVAQGEVAVKIHQQHIAPQHLYQGQSIRNVQHTLAAVSTLAVEDVSAWRKNELVFNQISIADAIEQFQRYSDFAVEVVQPELLQMQISGRFKTANYPAFMQILAVVAGLNVEKTANKHWKIEKK